MGSLFRFAYCCTCGTRHRQKPETCCGGENFKYSVWYVRYFAMGHSREEKIGPSRELAMRVLRLRETEVAEGRFRLQKENKALLNDFALGDYWKLYASKQKSAADFLGRLTKHIIPEFGEYYLHSITPYQIEKWLNKLDESLSVASVNRCLTKLKSLYRKANEWGITDNNPTLEIKKRKEHNEILRFLSIEEYHRLIEAADSEYLKAAFALAIGTMLRRENLFGLKWEHCDMENRTISIPSILTKSGESLILPIIEPLYQVLNSLPRSISGYVIVNLRTGTRYKQGIRVGFEKAKELAGIDPAFRWHDLRHTGASWLAQEGVDLLTIKELLGHKDISSTQRYAHLSPEHRRKQAEKIAARFESTADIQRMRSK